MNHNKATQEGHRTMKEPSGRRGTHWGLLIAMKNSLTRTPNFGEAAQPKKLSVVADLAVRCLAIGPVRAWVIKVACICYQFAKGLE